MRKLLAGLALAVGAAIVLQKSWTGAQREATRQPGEPKNAHMGKPRPATTAPRPQPPEQLITRTESTAAPALADSKAGRPEPLPQGLSKTSRGGAEVLNSATRQQLLSVYGIGPVLADRIIQNRPYAAAYDVVEQGIIPESIFAHLKKQLLDQPSA